MEYNKKVTSNVIEDIISQGVKDMPQNPASQGLTASQIKEFFYVPEKKTLELMGVVEDEIKIGIEKVETGLGLAIKEMEDKVEDIPSWAKEPEKPSYSYGEITDKPTLVEKIGSAINENTNELTVELKDKNGNVIATTKTVLPRKEKPDIGDVDLSDYQLKTDETLKTESKEVVGAINEVNSKVNNIDLNNVNSILCFNSFIEMQEFFFGKLDRIEFKKGQPILIYKENSFPYLLYIKDINPLGDWFDEDSYESEEEIIKALEDGTLLLTYYYISLSAYQPKINETLNTESKDVVGAINEVLEKVEEGSNVDLSAYQLKTDNTLETESKEVVGAINELNSGKVGFTDYATNLIAGVVRANQSYGIQCDGGDLKITPASKSEIAAGTQYRKPIVPETVRYAVKVGVTNNTETLTEEEKASALNWLGAKKYYKHYVYNEASIGQADIVKVAVRYSTISSLSLPYKEDGTVNESGVVEFTYSDGYVKRLPCYVISMIHQEPYQGQFETTIVYGEQEAPISFIGGPTYTTVEL